MGDVNAILMRLLTVLALSNASRGNCIGNRSDGNTRSGENIFLVEYTSQVTIIRFPRMLLTDTFKFGAEQVDIYGVLTSHFDGLPGVSLLLLPLFSTRYHVLMEGRVYVVKFLRRYVTFPTLK